MRLDLRQFLAVVCLLALGVAAGLALAPRSAEAVGGLSLQDRMLLAGEAVIYRTRRCQNPNIEVPVVPEGRRLFIYKWRSNVGGGANLWKLGGRITTSDQRLFSIGLDSNATPVPLVLQGGDPITILGYDAAGNEVALQRCELFIDYAYLL